MQPKAVLVLYQPGFKFKNNKYLLSLGVNIVGNDSKCQVYIDSKQFFPQDYVANFYVTQDFMYIQALCDNMVQFKSNMQVQSSGRKKDIYKFIDKNCRYILPMEQNFYIGPYKAIVQVQTQQQLKLIKNLLNIKNFQTPQGQNQKQEKYDNQNSFRNGKLEVQNDNFDYKSDQTQRIQSQNQDAFEPTLAIQDNDPYLYEPTLALDDQNYNSHQKHYTQQNSLAINNSLQSRIYIKSPLHSPQKSPQLSPIPSQNSYTKSIIKKQKQISQFSDISLFSRQKQKKVTGFSQQILYQTIRKQQSKFNRQNKSSPQQDEISMPDTVKDQTSQKNKTQKIDDIQIDMPLTVQQDEMPPTIPTDEFYHNNDQKINKTMYERKKNQSEFQKKQNLYRSQKFNKIEQDVQDVQDIFDLFRRSDIKKIDSNQIQPQQKKQFKRKPILNFDVSTFRNQRVLPQVNIQDYQSGNNIMLKLNTQKINVQKEKQQCLNSLNKDDQKKIDSAKKNPFGSTRLFKGSQKPKDVNVSGWIPKPEDRITLRKRGYQIVKDGRIDNYEILIIGKNIKASQKLLLAIILNKKIVTVDWLKDEKWQVYDYETIEGTVDGISWQIIKNQKGKRNTFEQAGLFYFTERLKDLSMVFEAAKGSVTKQLNKRKKINIIIDCEVDSDKDLYKNSKSCKNWKFYSRQFVSESVLVGELMFKKYLVDVINFD